MFVVQLGNRSVAIGRRGQVRATIQPIRVFVIDKVYCGQLTLQVTFTNIRSRYLIILILAPYPSQFYELPTPEYPGSNLAMCIYVLFTVPNTKFG